LHPSASSGTSVTCGPPITTGNTGGTNRIRHAVRLGDHAGHGADPDQFDPFVDNELDQFSVAHRACVAIDQNDVMAGGCERL
jgi:hypothetical protein